MDEHILAVFLVNESIPLSVIEPFHCSICQGPDLLSKITKIETSPGRHAGKGTIPKREVDLPSPGHVSDSIVDLSMETHPATNHIAKKYRRSSEKIVYGLENDGVFDKDVIIAKRAGADEHPPFDHYPRLQRI